MLFDSIETPFGKVDRVVGGACTYISIAASYFTKDINLVSVVGDDFPEAELKIYEKSVVLTSKALKLKKVRNLSFWAGKYHDNMNQRDTLATELNVLADFDPKIT